jgi:hypothetical protein
LRQLRIMKGIASDDKYKFNFTFIPLYFASLLLFCLSLLSFSITNSTHHSQNATFQAPCSHFGESSTLCPCSPLLILLLSFFPSHPSFTQHALFSLSLSLSLMLLVLRFYIKKTHGICERP